MPPILPCRFARQPADVTAGYSQIGEFAAAEALEFRNGAAIPLPARVFGFYKIKHGHSPLD